MSMARALHRHLGIPAEVLLQEPGAILDSPTGMAVLDLAPETEVHPAIVAGRVRHKLGNFRLLSQFVETGQVRREFAGVEAGSLRAEPLRSHSHRA